MKQISQLFNTPFKPVRGSEADSYFGNVPVWITEINQNQGLALSNKPPKDRGDNPDELTSAWHEETELRPLKQSKSNQIKRALSNLLKAMKPTTKDGKTTGYTVSDLDKYIDEGLKALKP